MSIGTVLYGPRYCGKTSFLEAIEGSVKHINTYGVGCVEGWEAFKDTVEAIEQPYEVLTVDGLSRLNEMCTEYICEQENEEHPSLAGNRKSIIYKKIKTEMQDVLFSLPMRCNHIFFTADMETKELNSSLYKGTFLYPKFDWVLEDIMPHITQQTICLSPTYVYKKVKSRSTGEVRNERKEKRIMICSARPDIYAGDSTGKLPKEIDAGTSGAEAYKNYMKEMK